MNPTTEPLTYEQITESYARLETVRNEVNSLARVSARLLAYGCVDGARKIAEQYVAADDQHYADLMALSDATHKLCGVES